MAVKYTSPNMYLSHEWTDDALGILSADFTGTTFALDTWYSIEIYWKRATGAGQNDGETKMWVNGTLISNQTGLDNDGASMTINRIYAGTAQNSGIDNSIEFYIDSIVADDASYIGPIAAGWTHKIMGIPNANIAKICGIAKANIAKVSGV